MAKMKPPRPRFLGGEKPRVSELIYGGVSGPRGGFHRCMFLRAYCLGLGSVSMVDCVGSVSKVDVLTTSLVFCVRHTHLYAFYWSRLPVRKYADYQFGSVMPNTAMPKALLAIMPKGLAVMSFQSPPMNFIFDGFLCGLLVVSISFHFQHLLVICEEIVLKMQEIIFFINFLLFTMSIFQSLSPNNAKISKFKAISVICHYNCI